MQSAQTDTVHFPSGRATAGANWTPPVNETPAPVSLHDALLDLDTAYAVTANNEAYATGALNFLPGSGEPAAMLPAMRPQNLGDSTFRKDHGLQYAYVAGAMANGIGSVEVVTAMARAGMLGFFGSAGLDVATVRAALERIQAECGGKPYGINFIHSPNEPALEEALADLLIEKGVQLVEASAFLRLTPAIVRYRLHGIHESADGTIVTPNRVIAKVSREEIAEKFFAPPPEKMLAQLIADGKITEDAARLAARIPVAQDITAEADSGGHTDHRPALSLLPTLIALRDRVQSEQGYAMPLRIGLGGGVATPESAAAAFAMGAAYLVTGTINQACVEAGTSDAVRKMLAEARQADVARAPAADMFEMGVTVQVLKRGTMFPMRASKLYELYRKCASMDDIPAEERAKLEQQTFRKSLDAVWADCESFFAERDPKQLERAARDARHKMALVFRWYLGQSSNWANRGVEDRVMDYQIWCGPAMGAFNEWTRGSELEAWENRHVDTVARNLLFGAALVLRLGALRAQGITVTQTPKGPWPDGVLASHFTND